MFECRGSVVVARALLSNARHALACPNSHVGGRLAGPGLGGGRILLLDRVGGRSGIGHCGQRRDGEEGEGEEGPSCVSLFFFPRSLLLLVLLGRVSVRCRRRVCRLRVCVCLLSQRRESLECLCVCCVCVRARLGDHQREALSLLLPLLSFDTQVATSSSSPSSSASSSGAHLGQSSIDRPTTILLHSRLARARGEALTFASETASCISCPQPPPPSSSFFLLASRTPLITVVAAVLSTTKPA